MRMAFSSRNWSELKTTLNNLCCLDTQDEERVQIINRAWPCNIRRYLTNISAQNTPGWIFLHQKKRSSDQSHQISRNIHLCIYMNSTSLQQVVKSTAKVSMVAWYGLALPYWQIELVADKISTWQYYFPIMFYCWENILQKLTVHYH